MAAVWFYERAGFPVGPFTTEELRAVIDRQPVPAKVKVWRAGIFGFKDVDEVDELRHLLGFAPTVAPTAGADVGLRTTAAAPIAPAIEPRTVDAREWGRVKKSPLLVLLSNDQRERVTADLNVLFGPRREVYINVFEEMRLKRRVSVRRWSWPAFLLSFVWFFYRKMYLFGATLIVVPIVLGLLFPGIGSTGASVVFGFLAKPTYVQSALRRILKADALGLSGSERAEYLKRAGGVSWVAGGLAGALYALLVAAGIYGAFDKPPPG